MKTKTRDRLDRARERALLACSELQRMLDSHHSTDPDPDDDTLESIADDLRDAAALIEDLP